MKLLFTSIGIIAASIVSCSNNAINSFSNGRTIQSSPDSPVISKSIKIRSLDEIETSNSLAVEYRQSPTTSVTLHAPEDVAGHITISEDDGTLECKVANNRTLSKNAASRVKIVVTSPYVKSFEATTASTISVDGTLVLKNKELEVECSTAATILIKELVCEKLSLEASTASTITVNNVSASEKVSADASTGASITIKGNAHKFSAEASTGASIKASQLEAIRGKADASTGGDITCNVKDLVIAKSTTGGSVKNGH